MADTTQESILFELKLNATAFKEEQSKVRQALADLVLGMEATKKKTAELETSRKAGKVADADYAQQSVKLREELKAQQADQRQLAKELETLTKIYQSGEGSLAQYRASLSELTAAYTNLSAAERASAEGQQLETRIRATSAELLKLEGNLNNHTRNVGNYGSAWQAAGKQEVASTQAAAGSIAALRQELASLEAKRETLAPLSKEAEELSTKILETKSQLQQSLGVIDEFGERVQRNVKREQFDTISDALSGLTAGLGTATLLFSDNETAAKAEAQALKLAALAANARSIAIGLASAPEAIQLGLLKAKSLFLKEEASMTTATTVTVEAHATAAATDAVAVEAQAAATTALAEAQGVSTGTTAASTAATEAQTVATTQATIGQRLLNLALRANPIGLVITLLAALVASFYAYSSASEKTQQKVRDITRALLLFTNPLGLAYLGVEKLYERFASVRAVLTPVVEGFEKLTNTIAKDARALGEWVGILDTAQQAAAKLAEQQVELAEATVARLEAEAKAMELAGATEAQVRAKQRKGLVERLNTLYDFATKQDALDRAELDRIEQKRLAKQVLSDKEKELLQKSAERNQKVRDAENALDAFDLETIERRRLARAAEAADEENNTQRAIASYRRRLEEGIASEKAALQSRLSILDRSLALVQLNSAEELELQRRRIQLQRDLDLTNLGATLGQERAIKRQFLAQNLADLENSKKIELEKEGLTEQQKQHIKKTYRDKAADTRQNFSTAEAQREVKARQDIIKNAGLAELKLTTDHLRQQTLLSLQAEQERNAAALALNGKAQAEQASQGLQATAQQLAEEYQLRGRAAVLERELALASLPARTDNTAAEFRIRAEASQKLAALDAAQADAARQRRAKDLADEAQHYTLLADAMLAGLDQGEQAQIAASETYKQQRITAVFDEQDARLALVERGSQEEVNIRQEAENKLAQIQQASSQAQLDLLKAQTEKVAAVITGSLNSLAAIQDADSQAKLARLDAEMNKEGVSAARKAIFEKQKLRIEQQAAEQRRKIARAQAVVNLGAGIMEIISEKSVLPSPLAEIAKGVEIAAATATAYAQFRAIDSAKFAAGGVLRGPSHAQGGIPLFHRRTGQPLGAEAEGDEIILTKGVYQNPSLRAMASALNVAGGGRALMANALALSPSLKGSLASALAIPARYAEGGLVPANLPDYLPQVRTGGVAQALAAPIDYDRLANTLAAKLGPAFVAGAQALPAPSMNLTELRERQQGIEKRKSLTDI